VLGFVGHEGDDVMHFAEFVVMMLLVGLELQPSLLYARPDSGTRRLAGGGYSGRHHHQFHLWAPGKWLWRLA